MPDPIKQYYEYLKKAGADVAPTFESFNSTLQDSKTAKTYYDYLKSNSFDAPDTFESFQSTLGFGKAPVKKKGQEVSSLDQKEVSDSSSALSGEPVKPVETEPQPLPPAPGPSATDFSFQLDKAKKNLDEFNTRIIGKVDNQAGGGLGYFSISKDPNVREPMAKPKIGDIVDFTSNLIPDNQEAMTLVQQMASLKRGQAEIQNEDEKKQYEAYNRELLALNEKNKNNPYYSQTGYKKATADGWVDVERPEEDFLAKNLDEVKVVSFKSKVDPQDVNMFYAGQNDPDLNTIIDVYDIDGPKVKELLYRRKNIIPFLKQAYNENKGELDTEEGRQRLLNTAIDKAYGVSDYSYNAFKYPGVDENEYKQNLNLLANSKFYQQQGTLTAKADELKSKINDIEEIAKTSTDPQVRQQYTSLVSQYNNVVNQYNTLKAEIKPLSDYFEKPENQALTQRLENQREGADLITMVPRLFPNRELDPATSKIVENALGIKANLPLIGPFIHGIASGTVGIATSGVQLAKTLGIPTGKAMPWLDNISKIVDTTIGDKTGIDNLPVEIINKVGGILPYMIPYFGQTAFTAGSAGTQILEAKRAGVDSDADLFFSGIVSGLVNKYAGTLLPTSSKGFKSFTPSREALGKFLNTKTRTEGAKLISQEVVSQLNKQYLKNVGEGAVHGVSALKIMEVGSAINNALLNKEYGTDLNTEVDMTFGGVAKELITMGIISGVTEAGGYLDRAKDYRPNTIKMYALTKAASDYPFALKYIENLKQMPNADMAAIQNTENAIAKFKGVNFPEGLSIEQKVATFNVIDNINTLKQQKAKSDPEFHEAIDNQIKELEAKKQEFINNPELAKSEVESQMKPLMDDAVLKAQEYAITESKQQEGTQQGNRVQPTRVEDGQPKEGQGEGEQGQGTEQTTNVGDSNIGSQGLVKDVESTAKALQGIKLEELANAAPGVFRMGRGTMAQQVAEAYHKAADGSNPELRRAVNKLLGIERPTTMEEAMQRLTPEQKQMYLDKVVAGDDQGASAMLDIAPEPPKVYTAENIGTATTEGLNETQAKVLGDAKTALPAISGIVKESTGNDANLNIHKDDASFGEAVVAAGGSRQDATSKGFYLDGNGNIHLNMQRVTTDTMLHESFHPLLDFIQKNAPEKIQELYDQLKGIKGIGDLLAKNERLYKNQGVTQVMKESITDFFAQVRDGKYNINASNFEKVKNFVYEVLNKIGLGPQAQKILNMKDAQELKDLINTIGERFTTGERVTAEDLSTVNMSKAEVEKLKLENQFAKGDELDPIEKDYKEAEKIYKNDKKEFNKRPELVVPEVQREKNGRIKIEVIEGEKGERIVTPLYSGISYNIENGAKKYISKNRDVAIDKLSDRLVDDYDINKDRPEILAAIGWYGKMRDWFQKNFGANIELFGQLLAATSARTEVIDNFKQAVDAMRNLSKGKYEDLLNDYDSFVNEIKNRPEEQLLSEWKEKYPKKRLSEFDAGSFRKLLINQYADVPLRSNGKKFNANSKKVLQAIYGNWIEQTKGPKTKNFAGNLTGRSFEATIDVWAARYLRRIIYDGNVTKWRIAPQSEGSVTYGKLKSGEMSGRGDYPFAEAVMRKAAEKIGIKPDDLQAFLWYLEKDVWDKNNWTNLTGKRKASFEEGASTIDSERYQAAVTTFRDEATFDPQKFEQERKDIQRIVGEIPGIIASRVTPSEGEFYSETGVFTEPTFDVEFTVDKGADIQSVIDKVSEIQNIYNQDAIIISKFVDTNAKNARPIIEIGLSKPVEKSEIVDDIKTILADMNVRGFTTARDSRGRILGIRSQFVPEFEKGVTIKEGGERFAAAFEKIKNKYGENPDISYISTGAVDSQVKFNKNETRTERIDEGGTTEQGIQGEPSGQQAEQGGGNRPEEKTARPGEGLDKSGQQPGKDGGVVSKPENGTLNFSREEKKDQNKRPIKSSEPSSVTAEDGWTFVRMSDGSYTDGDQVFKNWSELKKVSDDEGLGLRKSSSEEERSARSRETVLEIQEEIDNKAQFSRQEEINWERLKPGKGDSKISSRNPIVTKAAADLKDGKITNEEYRAVASENNPIRPITKFFEPATRSEVYNSLSSDKLDKIDTPIEDGSSVGIRLDIPAFKNNNTWVVSIHEGNTNAGKSISYSNVARITDVKFGLEPKAGLKIAAGESKSTIGRIFGKWQNIEGASMEDRGETAKNIIQDAVNNPDWVQIGFNPFRHSYFYDRSSDAGRPVKSADEVVQIGGLVYAKNPVYGNWTDEAYRVKGLFDSAGDPVQFSRQERVSKVDDLLSKKLISQEEYDTAIEKINKLYPPPTSVKNATVDEERAARGQEPVEKIAKESFGDWFDEAKFDVDNGYKDPKTLAQDIVKNPRAVTPVESATLLYGRMKLNNERAVALQNLERANASGDQKQISDMMFKLRQIETEIEMNDIADSRSGSMAGKALVARKMMLADDYSLTNVERRMKAANGGKPLDPELLKKITNLTEEIRIKDEKLKELEAKQAADPIATVIDNFKPKPGTPKPSKSQEKKTAILDKIRAKMNKGGGMEMSRSERPNPLSEYEKEIAELAKYYVEEGITDPIELVQKVREDVNELVEGGVEERDVQDVISGYGKRTFLSQDELAKQMREIKQQLKLFSALEDVSEGRLPEKSGLQRDQPSDEVRRLRQELNDAIKNSGLDQINKDAETQYKTALDAVKKRLNNQIKDLENQIATGERRQKKEGIQYDQEAIDLRNERDRLRGIIDAIDGREGMSAEQRLRMANASIERTIKDLQDRIANKDFSKREKQPLQGSEEEMNRNEQLKNTLNQYREDYNNLRQQEGVIEKERLAKYKSNLQKRLGEYETKLANKDFAPKPKKAPVVDEEVNRLKKEIAGVKFKIEEEKADLEWKNKSKLGKAVSMINEVRRGILLSSLVTLGKIGTAGTYIMAAKPLESMAGTVIRKLPWMKAIAEKAPREGQAFNPTAEVEAVTQLFKGMSISDVKNIMAGKPTDFEALYGDKTFTENEKSFLKYFGRSHAAIKYFPKTGEIYRSFRYRANDAVKKGEDIKDPIVYSRLMAEAILDGKREIFMGDNSIVDGYKAFIRSLESRDNLGSNITSGIFNFLLPIVKVPTNYVKSTGEYLAGTANAVYKIARKGVNNLDPQEADMVMRLFKKNLIGAGFLALGYLNPNSIGGYYTGKREEGDLEAMDIDAFGIKIPHWATHHPLMEVMQFGSTLRRLHDAEVKSGEEAGSMPTLGNVGTAGAKLIEEVPFLSTTGEVAESLKSDYKARNFIGNLASSLVPPDVKRVAKMRDVDEQGEPIKRRTTTVMEKVRSNIPGLREKLPEDPNEKKRVAREKIKKLFADGEYEYYSDVKDDFPELTEAADISNFKTFRKSIEMDKDVYRFYNNDADKQIKRWSALTEKQKEDYSEFLGTRESFEKAVKNKPELLKEARWKKAYEQILEIIEE